MRKFDPETLTRIYVLSDPRNTKVPKYIGFTTNSLRERLYSHLARAFREPNKPLHKWLIELDSENVIPTISLLETTTFKLAYARETNWIRFYRPLETLLNRSDGPGMLGLHNKPCPLNTQKLIARNKLGWTKKQRAKFKKTTTGRKWSEQRKAEWRQRPGFQSWKEKLLAYGKTQTKKVLSLTTNRTFSSVAEAISTLGVTRQAFNDCIRHGWRVKGEYWKIEPLKTEEKWQP